MQMRRSTFEQISHGEQMAFVRNGGQVVDDMMPAERNPGKTQIRRVDFDQLSPQDRIAWVKAGGVVVD